MLKPSLNISPTHGNLAPNTALSDRTSSSMDTHPKEANLISSGEFLLSVYADEILKIKNITNS
jgi:hypothetical protein